MSTDPYTTPETDVRVAESLPPRPVLGISLAFLFSFIGNAVLGFLFSLAITHFFDFAADSSADPTARIQMITRLFMVQFFVSLVIAFFAGFICIRASRSTRWRYLFILMGLSAIPTLLTTLQYNAEYYAYQLGGMVLAFVAMLFGARIAMIKLRKMTTSKIP